MTSFEPLIVTTVVVAALVTSIISGILGMAGGITLLGVMVALIPAGLVVPLHGVVQLGSNAFQRWGDDAYLANHYGDADVLYEPKYE